MGPTCKVSFKDMPVDDFAEASNTTLNFVVVLDSLLLSALSYKKLMKIPLTYLDLELSRRVRGQSILEPLTEICPNYACEETFHWYSFSL